MYEFYNEAQDAQFMAETLEKILKTYKKTGILTKEMKEVVKEPWRGWKK